MKILVGANNDRILGFTMIGSEAGEVMAVVQTAIIAGLPYTRLRDAVLAHPTMAEGLGFLLASVSSQRATGSAANLDGIVDYRGYAEGPRRSPLRRKAGHCYSERNG